MTPRRTTRKNFTIPRDCIPNPQELSADSTAIGLVIDQCVKDVLDWDCFADLVENESAKKVLQGFIFDGDRPTSFAKRALSICQNTRFKRETVERKLVQHFFSHGYKLTFKGPYEH